MKRSDCLAGLVVMVMMAAAQVAVAQMPGMPQTPGIPQTAPMPQPGASPMPMPSPIPPPTSNGGNNFPQVPSQGIGQGGGFLGVWCAQGDPAKRASISNNGAYLNLTNESGSTSIGNLQGPNRIEAQEWQFVVGTLSNDGQQINWSNGTFWARCPSGGGGGSPNLNGNWYPNGNRSLQCSIQQHRGNLTLQNETGERATGSIKGKRQVTTNWSGTKITGTVSPDGNRIDWSNGTYWIRYKVY